MHLEVEQRQLDVWLVASCLPWAHQLKSRSRCLFLNNNLVTFVEKRDSFNNRNISVEFKEPDQKIEIKAWPLAGPAFIRKGKQKLFPFNLMIIKSQTCVLRCCRPPVTCTYVSGLTGLLFLLDLLNNYRWSRRLGGNKRELKKTKKQNGPSSSIRNVLLHVDLRKNETVRWTLMDERFSVSNTSFHFKVLKVVVFFFF